MEHVDWQRLETYIPVSLNEPGAFALALAVILTIVLGRFLAVCGVAEWIFYRWRPAWVRARQLTDRLPLPSERWFELRWSVVTSIIFGVLGVFMGWMWQNGYAQFYLNFAEYGYWYLPVSWLLYAGIHDTIYYWVHRWMHEPRLYQWMHATHHKSLRPSVWASFSFHPYEALFQAAILPLLLLVIPIHPVVMLIHLTFMTLTALSNHLSHEILPRGFLGRWLGGWLISGTHHTQHHRFGRTNYGLFFTFWDRWMGTEHPRFREELGKVLKTSANG